MKPLKISEVAKAASVNIETIKYYEKRGILAKPERSHSGYRLFSETAVNDLLLIKKSKELGFTLREIEQLLAIIKKDDFFPKESMHSFALKKINEINEKIAKLEQFKSLLETALSQPEDVSTLDQKQNCPIIKKLKKDVHNEQND
ncbi:MerR family transcriptional regulator [Alkalihalobacillus sp. LMS39]|uniref:MerR family transcriptional regulator n=1 Tax=Alkalihalobacillus sp. LMS39 TaxID=2924032 RepID=UPI001FB35FCF|nr:MerR family transcriptional regulator [Alkalihalobacillus sp. LMS39]UOE94076.1 MerR family transcriptional regulator [Alkalihalobacillus sp. LMS39]